MDESVNSGNNNEKVVDGLKQDKLPRVEKFKLIMEYVKWFVVSVVLVVVALIVDSGFKSRDQGLKEITQYDKYFEVLVYNDNVGAKVKLAEFLSIISTSDDIRERWEIYLDTIRAEYEEYQKQEFLYAWMRNIPPHANCFKAVQTNHVY